MSAPNRTGTVLQLVLPALAALVLGAVLWPLFRADAMTRALHPASVAGLCWAGQLWYVSYSVGADRVADVRWTDLFGAANALTLLRGGLYAVVAGFVVVPPDTELAWVPALCYGAGAALDRVDGVVARTFGRQTPLGTRLDMAFDTFGFVAAPLLAVLWGRLPVWYLSLSAARYVFLAGLYWRRIRARPTFDTPDDNLGKYLAGIQMGFITVVLVPVVPADVVWAVAPLALAPSLVVFGRDYLVASGRLARERVTVSR
jgi:CDP-diacylglycerol--glycerol-3-phosphate 3-phosphatidyltransferase